MDKTFRRLSIALAASVVLHVGIILPWALPGDANPAPGRQIHLAATLRPTPKPAEASPAVAAPAKPKAKTVRAPKPGDGTASRLNAPGAKPEISTAGTQEPAPVETPESVPREAFMLDQAIPPEYPEDALRRNLEACVLASVIVAESGEVKAVEIIAADLPGVFDQAVIDSQKTARYAPARRKGEALESRVLAVASFVLTPDRRLNCALKFAPLAEKLTTGGTPAQ